MSLSDRIFSVESGGDANAKNPNSSALGAGQFIDGTWLAMLAKHRPDITGSRDELLALRTNKDLSREMTDAYAADNAGILRGAGLPVTPGTTYLAHFAGPKGAVGLLNADPSTPAGAIMGRAAVQANPFLAKMTAGDVAAWADRKMGGAAAPMSMAGPRPAAAPAPAAAAAVPAGATASADPAPAVKEAAFQITGSGGGAPAMDMAALAATPQLTNLLRPRPNLFGLKTAPFSLRG
jgi:hypothetical protein